MQRTLMGLLVVVGACSRTPTCEEVGQAAAKVSPRLADSKQMAHLVASCIAEKWPDGMRKCVTAAHDDPDLVACMLRNEQHANGQRDQQPPTVHSDDDAAAKLRVTSLDPIEGDADGGTYVHLKGNRFTADGARNVKVYFGTRQGTVVRFASDSEIIVEAPSGQANETVDVLTVFEPGGELKLPHAFTFRQKPTATP